VTRILGGASLAVSCPRSKAASPVRRCADSPRIVLEAVDRDLWIADGPTVRFYGFPYPTRAAIVRLGDGGLWVWSPIRLVEGLAREVSD
jgi:hypothetical protein